MKKVLINHPQKDSSTLPLGLYINQSQTVSDVKARISSDVAIEAEVQSLSYKLPNGSLCELHDSDLVLSTLPEHAELQVSRKTPNIPSTVVPSNVSYFAKLGLIDASISMPKTTTGVEEEKQSSGQQGTTNKNEAISVLVKQIKCGNIQNIQAELQKMCREGFDIRFHIVGGWNCLHYAAYMGRKLVVKLLLDQYKADPNSKTEDGLTSLHLATSQGHLEVIKILVRDFHADVDDLHKSHGTPLHCAAREGHLQAVAYLLMSKARIDLLTETGLSPIEVSTSDKITHMLSKYKEYIDRKAKVKKVYQIEELKGLKIEQAIQYGDYFIPPKPPKITGHIYKLGSMFGAKNRRFFVLNPLESTFAKYLNKSTYPDKPLDVYSLPSVQAVKKLPTAKHPQYHYFEFYYERKHQFCCKSEKSAGLWVKYLNCAIVYCLFLKKVVETIESPGTTEELKALNKELLNVVLKEPQKEVNIEDEESYDSLESQPEKTQSVPLPVESSKSLLTALEEDKEVFDPTGKVNFSSFVLLEKIGSGAFGSIFRVRHKPTGEIYAMKAISKRYLFKTKQLKYALAECHLLKMVDHPFVIKMHFAFQTPKYIYFILDYCGGGDLSMHIANKQIFKEDEARFYVAELILAIEYLHSLNIVYRDLKPDNILIGNDGHVKLSDFGLAKQTLGQGSFEILSFCGSPAYLSPEMLMRKAPGRGVDIYGVGTILYELLSGLPPYYDEDPGTMFANIRSAKLRIPKYISSKARSVLKALLEKEPSERITLPLLKKHPFFAGVNWEDVLRKKMTPPLDIRKIGAMSQSVELDELSLDNDEKLLEDVDYSENNKDLNRLSRITFSAVKAKPTPQI